MRRGDLGWLLMGFSLLAIVGVIAIAAWDGVRCGYGFSQFFARFQIGRAHV